ncbi:protein-tyrosine phosphatase-like protein [Cytidiella melzeri]|nr:protein-tyrosine phosphatase-like protein [Cytidiella melzeri]
MSEVVPNLWLGDLRNALDTDNLRERNIHSVLSAMRGSVKVAQTFNRLQINLDDTEEEDVLKHLVTCIAFIQAELDKGKGVLVHCMAGISRSASIVAAYLMYSQGLDLKNALTLIRQVRPEVEPNTNFVNQLETFYKASFSVSKHAKSVRIFYLERLVRDVKSGEVTLSEKTPMHYPPSPTNQAASHRRIRCKMCRQELATREHMLDHGQLSSPTPAVSYSPVISSAAGPSKEPLSSSFSDVAVEGQDFDCTDAEQAAALDQSNSEKKAESEDVYSAAQSSPIKTSRYVHASELSAQLLSNPTIAVLRSGLSVVPAPSPSLMNSRGSPILANSKCSGYFVEPLKWMDTIIEQGHMSGKITCPNKKCGAKLGNYDWAGVCCSCKEWVVPGFCIHRSKVDEIA